MVKVNICSLFRDSQEWHGRFINHVPRFFNQVAQQQLQSGYYNLEIGKVVCVYTESSDNTLEKIEQEKNKGRFNIEIIEHGSNYSSVKSTAAPERIKELSLCGCKGLDAAKHDCDYIFWVESDILIYDIFLLLKLYITFLNIEKLGIIAPLILMDTKYEFFYDSFVFRNLDGQKWQNSAPWSKDFYKYDKYIPMSSVGSCALINANLIREGATFGEGAFINLCNDITSMGHKVYCDKRLFIYHPSKNGLIKQRLC